MSEKAARDRSDDEADAKASYYDAYWKRSAALWALFREPGKEGVKKRGLRKVAPSHG